MSATTLSRRSLIAAGAGAAALLAVPRSAHAAPTGTTVNASSFGFEPTDATDALQAALDSTADTVIIDDVGADWITRPLHLRRSNVKVILAEGVTLRAKVGGYPGLNDSVLTVDDQEHVTIIGYGAQIVMNKPEYTTGEWRMALSLRSVRHTLVEGLTLRDSGGDGIYLGVSGTNAAAPRHSSHVILRNVTSDNHRRNCVSIISADDLLIEGCAFTNAKGTAPQAGIDFEPNRGNERITNVVMRDTVITGNASCQLVIAIMGLNADSAPVSLVIERVVLDDQTYGSPMLMMSDSVTTPNAGEIEIRDTVIQTVHSEHADKPGNLGFFRKGADSVHVTLRRCVLWNWGNPFFYYRPITVMSTRSSGSDPLTSYGGLTFDDCVLVTDQGSPVFNAIGTADARLANVHGNLAVIGPDTAEAEFGPDPVDVDLTLSVVPATPQAGALAAEVSIRAVSPVVDAGDTAQFRFTRQGGLLSEPLAVEFALSGTAEERHDYLGTAHIVVFAAGESTAVVDIATRPTSGSRPTSVTATLTDRPFYRSEGPPARRVTIR